MARGDRSEALDMGYDVAAPTQSVPQDETNSREGTKHCGASDSCVHYHIMETLDVGDARLPLA